MDDIKISQPGGTPEGDNANQKPAAPSGQLPESFALGNLIEPESDEKKAAAAQALQAQPAQPIQPEHSPSPLEGNIAHEPATQEAAVQDIFTQQKTAEEAAAEPKKGFPKVPVIIGAILLIVGVAGAAIYFGGPSSPFKGDVTTRFVAPEFCPTGQYYPKNQTELTGSDQRQSSIPTAKAQDARSTDATPPGEPDAVMVETATVMQPPQAEREAVSSEPATLTPQPVVETTTRVESTSPESEIKPTAVETTTRIEPAPAAEMAAPTVETTTRVETAPRTEEQPSGCIDIPKDDLTPGNAQCTLVDAIYADPKGYRLSDATEKLVGEWHVTCNPPAQPVCKDNETLSAAGECSCSENYARNPNTEACEYDCAAVVTRIVDLRSGPSTSPETTASLDILQREAESNKCEIPAVTTTRTACETYEETGTTALSAGDYATYYENSEKYIDENCSGRVANVCDARLGKAEIINRVLDSAKDNPSVTENFRVRMADLKGSYYSDPTCNVIEDRCRELEPVYGTEGTRTTVTTSTSLGTAVDSSTSTTSTTTTVADGETTTFSRITTPQTSLDPGSVFRDDEEYYNKNCRSAEETPPRAASSCEDYLGNIRTALTTGTTRDIWQNSERYIDENCSGNVATACSKRVARATVLSRLIDVAQDDNLKLEFASQFDTVKDEYFRDPECNSEQMCSGETDDSLRLQPELDIPPVSQAAPARGVSRVMQRDFEFVPHAMAQASLAPAAEFNLQPMLLDLNPMQVFGDYCPVPRSDQALAPAIMAPAPQPSLTCSGAPAQQAAGEPIVWSAYPVDYPQTPGDIVYQWSGDGDGNTAQITKIYNAMNVEKKAIVTASKDSITLTAECTVYIVGGTGGGVEPAAEPPAAPPPSPPPSSPAVAPPTPPSPAAPPTTTPETVASEAESIDSPQVSAPVSPQAQPGEEAETTITPPAPTPEESLHGGAPEEPVLPGAPAPAPTMQQMPQEITPTGPEVLIYIFGFLGTQLYIFRRRIFAFVSNK